MSISFSVHEFHSCLLGHPIHVIGMLWLDPRGIWLLGPDDLPAVEILEPLLLEPLQALIAPAQDYLAKVLIYGWLQESLSGWQLTELYEVCLKPLDDDSRVHWPVQIRLRQIPPIYDSAR